MKGFEPFLTDPQSVVLPLHHIGIYGAPERIRTPDLHVRSVLLCPLSYGGKFGRAYGFRTRYLRLERAATIAK